MADRAKIQALVVATLQQVYEQNQRGDGPPASVGTPLFGLGGTLDSLGLVNLIVAIEQRIEDELGVTLVLADERALAQQTSPFRTVATLVDYIVKQLDGNPNG